jgi:hypothetical protein
MPGKIEPDDWAALEADTAEIEAISIIREAYLNERGNLYSGETADIIEDAIFNAVKKAMGRHIKYLRGLMTTRSAVRVHVSKDKETARCFLDINVFADYDKIESSINKWKSRGGMVFIRPFPIGTTSCLKWQLDSQIGRYIYRKHGENIEYPNPGGHSRIVAEFNSYIRDIAIHEYVYMRETAQIFAKEIEKLESSFIH